MTRRATGRGEFLRDERGLETVEYSIIAGLVVASLLALIASLGVWAYRHFAKLKGEVGAP